MVKGTPCIYGMLSEAREKIKKLGISLKMKMRVKSISSCKIWKVKFFFIFVFNLSLKPVKYIEASFHYLNKTWLIIFYELKIVSRHET